MHEERLTQIEKENNILMDKMKKIIHRPNDWLYNPDSSKTSPKKKFVPKLNRYNSIGKNQSMRDNQNYTDMRADDFQTVVESNVELTKSMQEGISQLKNIKNARNIGQSIIKSTSPKDQNQSQI